jgi:DNA replication regulator SLD3
MNLLKPSDTNSFSARLPEQCGAISRKLGGPVVVSPARPKLMSSASLSAVSSRPGGITKRPVSTKARRSLRRVITDERHAREGSRGASGAISLMRSATAPAIPSLKRERSETPLLSSIPPAEPQSMLVSRGGVLKSKKFSQREVDLSSLATVNDAKLKKANIEAELKDAISALKRPNRQLAGQLQVEAETRAASASTHSRSKQISFQPCILILIFTESKKPVRNTSFQGVQILSTPKGNRRKGMVVDKRLPLGLDLEHGHELEVIPPSSIPRIAPFAAHARNARESEEALLCEATPARPATRAISTICRTPSHGQTKSPSRRSSDFLGTGWQNHGRLPPCSPLQARHPGNHQFLAIPSSFSEAVECTPSKAVAVHATPSKQEKLNIIGADACCNSLNIVIEGTGIEGAKNTGKSGLQGDTNDDSIYKSLGWDDYDDLG